MAIENRVYSITPSFDENDVLYHRESFGWTIVSATDKKLFFKRETTMPDYRFLVSLETNFDKALSLYTKYDKRFKIHKMSLLLLAIFTLLIGALLYVFVVIGLNMYYKSKQKHHLMQMNQYVLEARKIRYSSQTSGLLNY
ncbi:MAG: hypothetical protein WC939_04260 [Acholeplasmataceae bacterium]